MKNYTINSIEKFKINYNGWRYGFVILRIWNTNFNNMKNTDLRTEFTKETKTRFNTEWLAYNDYVDWLEQRLVKLLTIPPVINCPNCGSNNTTNSGIKPYKHYCRECTEHWN